ncbi:putative General negative regulator of transcription subunit 4 [Glarea lozoyensis 74030]|uniref:Putative General negative regulator of transcription subunit 4 n=1 Tax=Glarea lozoyensis (strain ATCC 74030 / MF5533) TaxID=1104152 RepID=H0EKT3_GLAL7|nr:putative General negative regulator of transcription subunit 4 [Glarea lozoyensis 74030]
MAPQDSFIDDEEETCPLCVEEFDLSDKNFRPCPCGYQFCFNNIKTNLNALCPACRRPYDEKTIEWKVVSPEEQAQFRANIQKNAKKKAEQRQKEAQKREVENLNRKHLSGLRVVQRNLVYVVGLNPHIPEKDLLGTLRVSQAIPATAEIVEEDPEVVPEPSQPQSTSENVSAGPPKPERDPILLNLLKSINEPDLLFSVPTSLQEHGASFPPLFDAFGGEKRAARKQQLQEEEARLRLEEESVEEEQVISEPVEEDEPESGSYQLGGEPEDRDGHRELETIGKF